jgi:hypothetical protein
VAIDPVTRKLIWEQFEKDSPSPGPSLNDWVATRSGEWGIAPNAIRRVLAEGSAVILGVVNERALTYAQEIAERMGADLVQAFEVLREGFHATKKRVLTDSHGKPRLIDNSPGGPGQVSSNMVTFDVPDWGVRLQAVRLTMDLFGAYGARPVQQYEMKADVKVVNVEMSFDQMLSELQRLPDEIDKLTRTYHAITTGNPIPLGPGKTIEGSALH